MVKMINYCEGCVIFQDAKHRIQEFNVPIVFLDKLTKPSNLYPIRFSQVNYTKPTHKLSRCKYTISIRGPYIWNKYLTKKKKKEVKLISNFKLAVKCKL